MLNTSERKRIDFIKYRHKHRHRVKIKSTNDTKRKRTNTNNAFVGVDKIEPTGCDLQLPSKIHPAEPTSCYSKPMRKAKRICDAQICTSGDTDHCRKRAPSGKRSGRNGIHFFLYVLCLVFLVPPQAVQAFCPPKCVCDDQHLSANCTQVPSISFVPMTFNPLLRHLTLNQLPMYELSNSLSFYRQLEYLDLKSNQIKQITYQNFNFKPASNAILPNHKHTDLTSQGILHGFNNSHEVLEYNIQVAKNLKQAISKSLDSSGSGSSDNEDEIKFHLRSLDLSDNRIEELGSLAGESDMFDGLAAQSPPQREDYQRVKSVVLEKTSPFLTLTKLERLGLRGNRLTHLHKHVFLGLVQLSTLDLSRNNIEHIDKHAFVGLVELKQLDLSYNKLARQLNHISIALCRAPMNELRTLNLGRNSKGSTGSVEIILPNQMFLCAPRLNELFLDSLNLQYIQVYAFDNLQTLEVLNLSQNYLEQVPSDSLKSSIGLGKTLKQLDLSDNLIEFVNADAFVSLRALERLFMNSMLRLVSFDLASLNTNFKPSLRFSRGNVEVDETNDGYSLPSALKNFLPDHMFKRQPPHRQDQIASEFREEFQPSNENLIELQLMHNIRLVSLHSSLAAGTDRPSVKMRFFRWEVLNLAGATELHELPLADMIELQQLPKDLRVDLSYASHLNCSSCQMDWLIRAARHRLIEVSGGNQQQSFSPLVRDWNLVLFDKQNPYPNQLIPEKVMLTSDTTGCFAPFNVPLMEFARIVETNSDRCINKESALGLPTSTNKQATKNPQLQPQPQSNNFPTMRTVMEQPEQPRLASEGFNEETSRLSRQQQQRTQITGNSVAGSSSGDSSKQIYSLLMVIALLLVFSAIVLKLVYTFLIRRRYGLKWRSPSSVTTSIDSPSSFQHNNFNQNLDRCLNRDGFLYDSTSYTQKHVPSSLQSNSTHLQERLDHCERPHLLPPRAVPTFNSIAFQTNVGPIERARKRNDLFSRIASFWHRTDQTQTSASATITAATKQLPPTINGLLPRHQWSISSTNATPTTSRSNELRYGLSIGVVGENAGDEILSGQVGQAFEQSNYYLAPVEATSSCSRALQSGVNSNTKVIEAGRAGHKVLLPVSENKYRHENGHNGGGDGGEQLYEIQRDIPFRTCNMTSGAGPNPLIEPSGNRVEAGAGEVSYGNCVVGDFIYENGQVSLGAVGSAVNSTQARKIQTAATSNAKAHDEPQSRLKQQQLEALNVASGAHLQRGSSACQSASSSMAESTALALHHKDRQDRRHRQTSKAAALGNSMSSPFRNSELLANTSASGDRFCRTDLQGTGSSSSSVVLETVGNYKSSYGTKENGSRNPNANDSFSSPNSSATSASRTHDYRRRDQAGDNYERNRVEEKFREADLADAKNVEGEGCFVELQQRQFNGSGARAEMFADDGHIYVTLDSRPIKQLHRQQSGWRRDEEKEEEDDYELVCAGQRWHELGVETTSSEVDCSGLDHRKAMERFGSQKYRSSAMEQPMEESMQPDCVRPTAETLRQEQLDSIKNQTSTNSSDSGLGLSSAAATNVADQKYVDPSAMSTGNQADTSVAHVPTNVNENDNCKDDIDEGFQRGSNFSNYPAPNDVHVIGQSEKLSSTDTEFDTRVQQLTASRRESNKDKNQLDANDGSERRANYAINDPLNSLKSDPMKHNLSEACSMKGAVEHKAQFGMGSNVFGSSSQQLFAGVNADRSRLPATTAGAAAASSESHSDGVPSDRTDMYSDSNDAFRLKTTNVRPVNVGLSNTAVASTKYDANHARQIIEQEVGHKQLANASDRGDYLIDGRACEQNKRSTSSKSARRRQQRRQRQQLEPQKGESNAVSGKAEVQQGSSVTAGNEFNNNSSQTSSRSNHNYGDNDEGDRNRKEDNVDDFADRQDSILIGQHANEHIDNHNNIGEAVMFGKSALANNAKLTRTDSASNESNSKQNGPVISAFNSGPLAAATSTAVAICGGSGNKENNKHKQRVPEFGLSFAGSKRNEPLVCGDNNQQNNCDSSQQEAKRLQTSATTTRSNHTHTTNTLGSSFRKPNKQQPPPPPPKRTGGNEIYSNQFYYCRPKAQQPTCSSATLTRHS